MNFARDLVRWVKGSWRFWAVIVIVCTVVAVSFAFPASTENSLRYAGLGLQLVGIFTVALGLSGRRRLFGRPSLLRIIRTWFKNRPRCRKKVVDASFTMSGSGGLSIGGGAEVSFERGIPEDASIVEQVEALRETVRALEAQQREIRRTAEESKSAFTEAIKQEVLAIERVLTELNRRLDQLGVGGLHVEAAGVFWLILGVVFATVPQELAQLIAWFF